MGLFRRATEALRSGLTKTRTALTGVFGALAGRKIDEEALQTIEASLLRADVGPALSTSLVESLRTAWRQGAVTTGEEARDHLAQDLRERLSDHRGDIARAEQGPTVLLVVGVNGAGKTTSIAKLAKRFSGEGKVVLAAADTFRAGAVHQLEVWAERLGVDIIKGKEGADPAAVAWDGAEAAVARNADFLIVDTAGRLHVQEELMRELSKIKDVLGRVIPSAPHESLLVLDATAGQNGLRQAEHFLAAAAIDGIVLAKLDGTARGGVALSIREHTGVPVKFVGTGERPEDLEVFDPEPYVDALLGLDDGSTE